MFSLSDILNWLYSFVESCFWGCYSDFFQAFYAGLLLICITTCLYNLFVIVLFLEQSIFVDNFSCYVSFSIDFAACALLRIEISIAFLYALQLIVLTREPEQGFSITWIACRYVSKVPDM